MSLLFFLIELIVSEGAVSISLNSAFVTLRSGGAHCFTMKIKSTQYSLLITDSSIEMLLNSHTFNKHNNGMHVCTRNVFHAHGICRTAFKPAGRHYTSSKSPVVALDEIKIYDF